MARIPLPVSTYSRGTTVRTRLLNCFAEQNPPIGQSPVLLRRCPGIVDFAALPTPIRGAVNWAGKVWAVGGQTLYSIDVNANVTAWGSVFGAGRVMMVPNRTQLMILRSDGIGYVYEAGVITQITDVDFGSATHVAFLDNFMVCASTGTDRFFSSELGDATDWNALSYAYAEGYPDNIVALLTDQRQIMIFGESTLEIWWNAGTTPFPFERVPNGLVEIGCAAPLSPAKIDNTVFWLDDDRICRSLRGLTPVRISSHAVEAAWRRYARVDDAYSFTWAFDGHLMYTLTFPSAEATWCFDVATNEWHERASFNSNVWQVTGTVQLGGKWLAWSDTHGLGEISTASFAEWGSLMRMEWGYPQVYAEKHGLSHQRFEIVYEAGVGLATGQGDNPTLGLDLSDDAGKTWKPMPSRSLGAIGSYGNRAVWHQLGASDKRVYRAWVSDPVSVTVQDTILEVSGAASYL